MDPLARIAERPTHHLPRVIEPPSPAIGFWFGCCHKVIVRNCPKASHFLQPSRLTGYRLRNIVRALTGQIVSNRPQISGANGDHHMTRQLTVAVLSGLFLLSSLAMVHSLRAQSTPPKKPMPVSDQMTSIPYFTLRDGMSSTLTLNNIVPSPTQVTVTIYNMEGKAQMLAPITLDPHSFKQIELRDVVVSEEFDSGNVEVAFKSIAMGVTCQISVSNLAKRVSFESREQDMMDFNSSKLNGIVSLPQPDAEGFLAMTNTSKNKVTIQVGMAAKQRTVTLYPRQTHLLKLSEEFDQPGSAAALVKLQQSGLPGDIITTGFVLNLKDGYSSSFAMVDPALMRSSHLAGAHLRIGEPAPSEDFPDATYFRSPLLLGNVGASPVVAHVSVDYTVQEKVRMTPIDSNKADATEDKFNTVAVKTLTIAPGDVQRVELSETLQKLGVARIEEAGVDIDYDTPPGTLIGHLVSVDQSGDYSFEVPIKDASAMNEMMAGIYPWSLENGNNTVVHLKNTTSESVKGILLLDYYVNGINETYDLDRLVLKPYQTVAIDVRKLRDSKKLDMRGKPFPADVTHGQAQWHQDTPYSMIGRAEETNAKEGIARSFSCSNDCCYYYREEDSMTPTSLTGPAGGGGQLQGSKLTHECNGITYGPSPETLTSWSSGNTSVATVDSAGNVSYKLGGSTTVGAWARNKHFEFNDYYKCMPKVVLVNVGSNVQVNGPDHVRTTFDNQGKTACPPTGGYTPIQARVMNLQLVDVNHLPVKVNYSNYEKPFINLTNNTCGTGSPSPASCFTTGPSIYCAGCGPGEFNDTMAINHSNAQGQFCSTVDPRILAGNPGCGFSLSSEWAMCSNGLTNNIWLSTRGTYSNLVIVNGNQSKIPDGTIYY
jgi:hypothetical protein